MINKFAVLILLLLLSLVSTLFLKGWRFGLFWGFVFGNFTVYLLIFVAMQPNTVSNVSGAVTCLLVVVTSVVFTKIFLWDLARELFHSDECKEFIETVFYTYPELLEHLQKKFEPPTWGS